MKIDVDFEEEVVKPNRRKTVKNGLISIIVLLALTFVGSSAYVYYIDLHNKPAVATATVDTSKQLHPIVAVKQDPNAPVGVAIEVISSPIPRGGEALASVKSYPNATCVIKVMYNNVASTETGLESKVADDFGVVSWSWNVSGAVPIGSWPVDITCAHHSKSGYVQGSILITAN